jgi:hypothetical protein
MPSGPYERFYPGEDKGLLDPTWGGGAHRLSAPSVSQHGGTMALSLLGGPAVGYGAKLGYQGIVRGGQALDRVLPALKTVIKRAAPVWGEGVLDYGVGKQTEKEVEKVVKKVKERRREPAPLSRLKTGEVRQSVESGLTGASWYSRAEDTVLNAKQRKATADQWISEIGRSGGKKELNMSGDWKGALKKAEGSLNQQEVLTLLQPYTIQLEEKYYTNDIREATVFELPRWTRHSNLHLDDYGLDNQVEILLKLPQRHGESPASINFIDHDWNREGPKDNYNVVVHIRGNDGKLFNLPAFIIQEIQSNWHQKGQAEGYRQPMPTPDDMELKRVSVEEAFHYGQSRIEDDIQWRQTTTPWWEMVDFQDWQEHRNLPEGTPVTLYRMKGSDKWELAPESDITLDELWNREFDYYSGGETRPNDAFYDAFEASSNNRPPDGPYKTTWHELGFKRALMEALRDPNKEYLAWTTGEVQAERNYGENWEDAWPEKSKFPLQLYNEKMVRFAKKFLGVTPQLHKPGEWTVFDSRNGNPVRYFDSADEASKYVDSRRQIRDAGSPNAFLDYDRTKGDLWYIKIDEEMRDKFIKTLEGELPGGKRNYNIPLHLRNKEEVQMPTAQKEGGGLLGRYA